MVINLTKNISSIADTSKKVIDLTKGNDTIKNNAADTINIVEKFLNIIGDTNHSLKDNVIDNDGQAILMMLIFNRRTHKYEVMIVCFDNYENDITSIEFFKRSELQKISNYVEERILSNNYKKKIYDICQSLKCNYYLKDGCIYLKDDSKEAKIVNLKSLAFHEVAEVVLKLRNLGIQEKMRNINGIDYLLFPKKQVDALLDNKYNIYSILTEFGIIYYRIENCKRYFSYRDRSNEDSVEYFAINKENFDKKMQGGILSA